VGPHGPGATASGIITACFIITLGGIVARVGEGAVRARIAKTGVVLACTALLGAAAADAELTQKGDLFIHFNGGISPRALPRNGEAPIAVRIDATIRVPNDKSPPPLRHIDVAFNKHGRLTTAGLPVCRHSQIDSATTKQAFAACRSALVGAGGVVGRTSIADQTTYPLRGDLLLFNSRDGGRPAILAHVYQSKPVPISHVFVFHIGHHGGAFGTTLSADLPYSLNHAGYLRSIFLSLQRTYTVGGRTRSYLSAGCPAPAGFPRATFPVAHISMGFGDGRTLSSTLIRTCRVRG
jgi:hypothetical protein